MNKVSKNETDNFALLQVYFNFRVTKAVVEILLQLRKKLSF